MSADSEGNISPIYLSDHEDENGKVKPRLVNIDSQIAKLCFQNLDYITKEDYQKVAKILGEPAAYDFYNILNWN